MYKLDRMQRAQLISSNRSFSSRFKKINFRRTIRKRKTVISILGVYLLICCIYYYFFISSQWTNTQAFFERTFNDKNFASSLSSSLLDDLVIFLTLSLIVLVLTTKKLSDYTHSEKISAIINDDLAADDLVLEDYLKKTVAKATIYEKLLEFNITVTAFNAQHSAYRIVFEAKHLYANMCNDQEYREDSQYWQVTESDAIVNNEVGHITQFQLRYFKRGHHKATGETTIISPSTQVKLDQLYEAKVPIEINKNTHIEVNLNYYTWSKTSDTFDKDRLEFFNHVKCIRFVQSAIVRIKNLTSKPIEFNISTGVKEEFKDFSVHSLKQETVLPGEEFLYEHEKVLYPGSDIRVFLFKPHSNEYN